MPIRHGGILASRASTWSRDHFCRSTMAPRASWPTTWNEFLPISMPGDRGIGCLRHGVLLVFGAPCQLRLLAGQEHGRTIPLADYRPIAQAVLMGFPGAGSQRGRDGQADEIKEGCKEDCRQAGRCEAYPPRRRQPADCEGRRRRRRAGLHRSHARLEKRRRAPHRTIPGVRKAVKWNSPLYGVEGYGWFLGIHCFTKYVKVAFFRGALLRPVPPGDSKSNDTRYIDIREGDELDEVQMADWVKQAAELPGFFGPRS